MCVYLDIERRVNKNKYLTGLFGGRGIGKTYGLKKFLIEQYIKNGSQFVWIRRYKSDLRQARTGFFNKMIPLFPDNTFKVNGNTLLINNKVAGFLLALSDSDTLKGNDAYDNVKYGAFDEYMLNQSAGRHYIKNEMELLDDLVETIARTRTDFRLFFLSNSITQANPLFLRYGVNFNHTRVFENEFMYIELCETSKELIEMKKATPQFQMALKYSPEYADYNLNNSFLNDIPTFIEKRPQKTTQLYCLIFSKKDKLFVYAEKNLSKLYVSKRGDINQNAYTFSVDCVTEKIAYIDYKSNICQSLTAYYKRGSLFFDDIYIKQKIQTHVLYRNI